MESDHSYPNSHSHSHSNQASGSFDQLRLRYLSSILVRNITLNPLRDRALRSLAYSNNLTSNSIDYEDQDCNSREPFSFPPGANASDDADLALAERNREKERSSIIRRNSRDVTKRRRNSLSESRLVGDFNPSNTTKGLGRTSSGSRNENNFYLMRSVSGNSNSGKGGEGETIASGSSSSGSNNNNTLPRPAIRRSASSATHLKGKGKGKQKEIESELENEDEEGNFNFNLSSTTTTTTTSSIMISPRPRTTSTTSWTSGKSGKSSLSVRFDASSSSSSNSIRAGNRSNGKGIGKGIGISTWTTKSLENVMTERLCETYVTLSLPKKPSIDESKSKSKSNSRIFFETKPSAPSIHASWGLTPPINPMKEFDEIESDDHDDQFIEIGNQSKVIITLYGKNRANGKGKGKEKEVDKNEWHILFEREIDLGELERIGTDLSESSIPLPPNSVLLGLTITSSQDENLSSISFLQDSSSSSTSRKESSSSEIRRRAQVSSQVCYYLVRPPSLSSDPNPIPHRSSGEISKSFDNESEEKEDYNSDPEIGNSSSSVKIGGRRRSNSILDKRKRIATLKIARNQHKAVMERSLRETRMMKSYDLKELKSLLEAQESLRRELKEEKDLRTTLNEELSDENSIFRLKLRYGEDSNRLERLKSQVQAEESEFEDRRKKLSFKKEALSKRKERLEIVKKSLGQKDSINIEKQKENIKLLKNQSSELSIRLYNRRVSLLKSLEFIFPIELIDASNLLFTINDLPLPNNLSDDKINSNSFKPLKEKEIKIDDETISSSLGLISQLIILLSTYLSIPIHYPIASAGSRAIILDPISNINGQRTFPLYSSKEIESYRFQYAIFLLNKNIQQLLLFNGLNLLDLKHTLPNLKNLLLTLTAKEFKSNDSRKKLIGKNEISLKSDNDDDHQNNNSNLNQSGLGKGLPSSSSLSSTNNIGSNISLNKISNQSILSKNGNNGSTISSNYNSSTISSGWGSSLFSGWRGGGGSSTISKINEDKREENESQYPIVRKLG